MKPSNNKLAVMFTALVIFGSSAAPASATVSKNLESERAIEKSIDAILDDVGANGWGVPSSPDARDTPEKPSQLIGR